MVLDHLRPHAFRQRRTEPDASLAEVGRACRDAERRIRTGAGLDAWAVYVALDRMRVMTVETWRDAPAYRRDADRHADAVLCRWAATGGVDPTPVATAATAADAAEGVVVIDLFRVWRPLLRPVVAFTVRNGRAFDRAPGCISTTVMRGIDTGAIATFARWSTVEAFTAAFATITGRPASTTDDVNRAAARMTRGLIRPDYHAYALVASGPRAP